jgi:cyclomaltodextrinase / maltogenic alpha-amylase / neopullulanase
MFKLTNSLSAPLLLAAALLAMPAAAIDAPIAFSTAGGEAWTFDKRIEGSVVEGRCDEVAINSPVGTVVAHPHGGRVVAQVPLAPGDNRIEAECRRNGAPQGIRAWQSWRVRLRDAPKVQAHASVTDTGLTLDARASERAPVRGTPIADYQWRAHERNAARIAGLPAQGPRVVLPTPTADGEYQVILTATDRSGRSDESTAMFRVRNGQPEVVDLARQHASWIDRAIVYGVVPALFGPRGLRDVTERLDQLAALGINTLWLSPITASPPGDFGYAVTDHFRLRPELGSEADLHALIRAAHARGMRVIIDFVPNHLSDQHTYFADVAAHARASPYYELFARTPAGETAHYFDWRNLKNLDYDNFEVQRLVIEAFAHWVRAFDVDGFRVDVAWGPRERAPQFWPRWRAELKRIKPDLLLLAEASARDPYYGQLGFDAAYDWTDKLGEWTWRDAFENEAQTAMRLRTAIAASASEALVFRFLNNNDTGARFLTRYGLSRTRVAAAMLLTLPGIPGLYTGDEVGAAYEPYRDAQPIAWDDPHDLQTWYARLIALRHSLPALRSRDIRLLDVLPSSQMLAYLRGSPREGDNVIVLLNYGAAPLSVTLPDDVIQTMSGYSLIDLLNGNESALEAGRLSVSLPAYGVRVLKAR